MDSWRSGGHWRQRATNLAFRCKDVVLLGMRLRARAWGEAGGPFGHLQRSWSATDRGLVERTKDKVFSTGRIETSVLRPWGKHCQDGRGEQFSERWSRDPDKAEGAELRAKVGRLCLFTRMQAPALCAPGTSRSPGKASISLTAESLVL